MSTHTNTLNKEERYRRGIDHLVSASFEERRKQMKWMLNHAKKRIPGHSFSLKKEYYKLIDKSMLYQAPFQLIYDLERITADMFPGSAKKSFLFTDPPIIKYYDIRIKPWKEQVQQRIQAGDLSLESFCNILGDMDQSDGRDLVLLYLEEIKQKPGPISDPGILDPIDEMTAIIKARRNKKIHSFKDELCALGMPPIVDEPDQQPADAQGAFSHTDADPMPFEATTDDLDDISHTDFMDTELDLSASDDMGISPETDHPADSLLIDSSLEDVNFPALAPVGGDDDFDSNTSADVHFEEAQSDEYVLESPFDNPQVDPQDDPFLDSDTAHLEAATPANLEKFPNDSAAHSDTNTQPGEVDAHNGKFTPTPSHPEESRSIRMDRTPGGFDSGRAYDLPDPIDQLHEASTQEKTDPFDDFVQTKLRELQDLEKRIQSEIAASEQKVDQILNIADKNEKVSQIGLLVNQPAFGFFREKLLTPLREEGSIFPKIMGHLSKMERKLSKPALIDYVEQIIILYQNDDNVMEREPSLIQRLENYKNNITEKPSELLKTVHTKLNDIKNTQPLLPQRVEKQIAYLDECLNAQIYQPVWHTIHTIAGNILTQKIDPHVFEILDELILENRVPALQCFMAGFDDNSVFYKKLGVILKDTQIKLTRQALDQEKKTGLAELKELIDSPSNWTEKSDALDMAQTHPQIIQDLVDAPATKTQPVADFEQQSILNQSEAVLDQILNPAQEIPTTELSSQIKNTLSKLFQTDPQKAIEFAQNILLSNTAGQLERNVVLGELAQNRNSRQAGQVYLMHKTIDAATNTQDKIQLIDSFGKIIDAQILEKKKFQIKSQDEQNQASSIFTHLFSTKDPAEKNRLFAEFKANPLIPDPIKATVRKGAPAQAFDRAFEAVVMSSNTNENKLKMLVTLKNLAIRKNWLTPVRQNTITNKINWYKHLITEATTSDTQKKARDHFYTSRAGDIAPLLKRTKAPFSIVDQEARHIRDYQETQARIQHITQLHPEEDKELIKNLKKDIPADYKNKADAIIAKKLQVQEQQNESLIQETMQKGLSPTLMETLNDSPLQAVRWYGRLDESFKNEFIEQSKTSEAAKKLLDLIERELEFKKTLRQLRSPIDAKILEEALENFTEERYQLELAKIAELLDSQNRKQKEIEEKRIKKEEAKLQLKEEKKKAKAEALRKKEEARQQSLQLKEEKRQQKLHQKALQDKQQNQVDPNDKARPITTPAIESTPSEIKHPVTKSDPSEPAQDVSMDNVLNAPIDIMQPLPELDNLDYSLTDSLAPITEEIDMSAAILVPDTEKPQQSESEKKVKKKKRKSKSLLGSLFSTPRRKAASSRAKKQKVKAETSSPASSAKKRLQKNIKLTHKNILEVAGSKPYITEEEKNNLAEKLSSNAEALKNLEDQSFLIRIEHPDKQLFLPPVFLSVAKLKEANRDRKKKAEMIEYFENFINSNRSNKKNEQYIRAMSFIEKYRLK